MKNIPLNLRRTAWSKTIHGILIFIIIAGFICTTASFIQAVTTSENVVSRVVNHNKTTEYTKIGFISLGITALALLMFSFSSLARNKRERNQILIMASDIEVCQKNISELKKAKKKSSKQ